MSPDAMAPSVKVLALKLCFAVAEEVKTLLSFMRCFPHVETLHVMLERMLVPYDASEASGSLGTMFWKEVGPIECVQFHGIQKNPQRNTEQQKPQDFDEYKLDRGLIREFLTIRFTPSLQRLTTELQDLILV